MLCHRARERCFAARPTASGAVLVRPPPRPARAALGDGPGTIEQPPRRCIASTCASQANAHHNVGRGEEVIHDARARARSSPRFRRWEARQPLALDGGFTDTVLLVPRRSLPPVPAALLGGPGLLWGERPPDPRLAPWVATTWNLRCEISQPLRVLPDGCMDIIGKDLVGTLTRPLVADLRAGDVSVGIRLRPGAFTALFGIPADEFRDQRLPLAQAVRPRPLTALAAEAPVPDPLAALALHAPSVRWLTRETGYSERHLRRRLIAATGHGPTRLRRIGRMQALLSAGRGESWASTAAEFGYHDESHMINDVRSLAGANPQRLLRGRSIQDR